MHGSTNASALQCTLIDYNRVRGYANINELAKQQKQASRLFELVDGGMKLPFISTSIQASPLLDRFVVTELEMYRNPDTRKFGENMFSVIGSDGNYRLGYIERYCGSTLRMSVKELKAKSGGNIAAIVHTHPYFHHLSDARQRNREGGEMARRSTLTLFICCLAGCTSTLSPPEFNSCWTLFPPGPDFDRQINEYDGPSSPEELAAACLPLYQLDADTCARFSKAGSGDWPGDVEQWCREKYQIRLDVLR
jgi:hypothetical protein